MTEQEPFPKRRHWIFCSSGAHPLFLENVVRALALPSGEVIKFRYEAAIVSGAFQKLSQPSVPSDTAPVLGDIAYLCYLDNREKSKPPKVYPVRDATIQSVTILGSTFIIELCLECFIHWPVDANLDEMLVERALDPLPHWIPNGSGNSEENEAGGCWLAEAKSLPDILFRRYGVEDPSYLEAFESAAKALWAGSDFSDGKRMFATITGIFDGRTKAPIQNEAFGAGKTYDIHVYQFQPGDSTHNRLEKFRFLVSSDNPDVTVVGSSERHVEAPYDQVVFTFQVTDDARDGRVNLGLDIIRIDQGSNEPFHVLRGQVLRKVKSSRLRKIGFGFVIGLGLFGTQAVTLFNSQQAHSPIVQQAQIAETVAPKPPVAPTPPVLPAEPVPIEIIYLAAFAFSMLAGMGASFGFKTKV